MVQWSGQLDSLSSTAGRDRLVVERLRQKTALVTAAGQGIGRATAAAFAQEGARVFATDIDGAQLAGLTDARITTAVLDVTDPEAIRRAAVAIGPVDVLFNCAGIVHDGTVLDCTESDWDEAFTLNARAMYRMIRAFLPGMLARGSGSIINVASVASSVKGVPDRFVYSASKAAVIGITRAVAADFVGQGIRCNVICPGTVQTPSLETRLAAAADPAAARRSFIARQPMQRFGTPEEIAALAVHLAGDESAFTTGAIHLVDGGWSA